MNSFFKYSSLGLQIVITIVIFVLIGRYLDNYFKTIKPWFTLFMALLASTGIIVMIIQKLK